MSNFPELPPATGPNLPPGTTPEHPGPLRLDGSRGGVNVMPLLLRPTDTPRTQPVITSEHIIDSNPPGRRSIIPFVAGGFSAVATMHVYGSESPFLAFAAATVSNALVTATLRGVETRFFTPRQ